MRGALYLITALIGVTSTPADAAEIIGDYGGWTVFRGDDNCGMTMEFEGPGSTELTFIKFADGVVSTLITNYEWSAQDGQKYDVTYSLNGSSYSGVSIGTRSGARGGFVGKFKKSFENDFAQGSSLYVYLGEQQIDQLSLDGTSSAMSAINRCLVRVRVALAEEAQEKAKYAHLPKDPFASSPAMAANQAPQPIEQALWLSRVGYYPLDAEREGIEGAVKLTAVVGADGRVRSCRVTESSGSDILDTAACERMQRYARFSPATDSEGAPTDGEYATTVNYRLKN